MTTHTIINPATEQPVRQVALSTAEQTDEAESIELANAFTEVKNVFISTD